MKKNENLTKWMTINEWKKIENEYQKYFEKIIKKLEEERMKNPKYRMMKEKFEEWLKESGCLI